MGWSRIFFGVAFVVSLVLAGPLQRSNVALAAECTPRASPGIPPPATVPSGIPGFHAAWYGQSGYPTLCPGETSVATVAFYNSGSSGWESPMTPLKLGTSGPEPGQDQPSILGGDFTHGTPYTRWYEYNRPAIQPAPWIGPGQVAWFQFTVKAPPTPGTYRFYLRPLIEHVQWLEDFGVYWQVTVIPTSSTPLRVAVDGVEPAADVFTAGGTRYLYDANDGFEAGGGTITLDGFERRLTPGDLVDVRYEPSAPDRSMFDIVDDPPGSAPTITATVGSFHGGPVNDDIRVDLTPPPSGTPGPYAYVLQRAHVAAGTSACSEYSGSYDYISQYGPFPVTDRDVASGTYCYRANAGGDPPMFGYSGPVTIADPPTPATSTPPRSLDARAIPSAQGDPARFDYLDQLKIAFDQPIASCASAILRLRDADGTIADLDATSRNISCSVNAAAEDLGGVTYATGTVLTVTLAASPTIVSPGTAAGLQVPATLVGASGVASIIGAAWDVAGSPDVVFGVPD